MEVLARLRLGAFLCGFNEAFAMHRNETPVPIEEIIRSDFCFANKRISTKGLSRFTQYINKS
jgi:hypothetical protein